MSSSSCGWVMLGKLLRHHYKIVQLLGSGGFGDTYLAVDLDLPGQPQCVVKHLKPKDPNPAILPIAKNLFEREAQILYKLGNENHQIPKLFAHFEENGEFYLVQEFVDGHDLSLELTPGLPKSENVVFKLLKDILEVLAVVHQHNVIHRDIKPQNLMRRRSDGKIVLIDFGAVKEISALGVNTQGQTSVTVAIGSPGYMPSEQANGKPKLSSDVYALGMLGIQALTGFMPHQLQEDPRTGEVIWRNYAQVSDRLADVIDTMVRYDFRQRYQSADEALQALISTLPSPPPVSPTIPSPPQQSPLSVSPTVPSPPQLTSTPPSGPPSTVAGAAPSQTRRKFLTILSFAGVGLGGVLVWEAVRRMSTQPEPSHLHIDRKPNVNVKPNNSTPIPLPTPPHSVSSTGVAIVFDPPSNVRTSPNGDILCSIRNRTTINIYGSTGSWYYTDVCGKMGVIHSGQIKF